MGNSKSKHDKSAKYGNRESGTESMDSGEGTSVNSVNPSRGEQRGEKRQRTLVSFIYHRASSLFIDDDGLEGHEFYEETRKRSSGKWILKRVARRHLRHCEFKKLAKPFIHIDCPVMLLGERELRELGAL